MTNDPQTLAWLDQEDAHLAQTIRAHRWAVQYVGEGEEPGEPAFAYTVGLYGLGHPELVVVGLGPDSADGILGRAAGMVGDGRDLVVGELTTTPAGRSVSPGRERGGREPESEPVSFAATGVNEG